MKNRIQPFKRFATSVQAKVGVAAGMLVASGLSQAAAIDIDMADVLATLAAAVVTVTTVCAAAISIVVVVKVFKYVRAAL